MVVAHGMALSVLPSVGDGVGSVREEAVVALVEDDRLPPDAGASGPLHDGEAEPLRGPQKDPASAVVGEDAAERVPRRHRQSLLAVSTERMFPAVSVSLMRGDFPLTRSR